jgi:hypothetical protein
MRYTRICLLFLYWLACGTASASPLFESEAPIMVKLSGPFNALFDEPEENDWQPFRLETGDSEFDIRARVRGKSRREICEFPPLKLDLGDAPLEGTEWRGQQTLKLVTHCLNGDRGDANVLEEYLAYRIFELLSPVSFRVRLLEMDYSGSDGELDKDAQHRWAFLIEPEEQLVRRTNGESLFLPGISLRRLNDEQAALVYVFQYLIGNTDWSLVKGNLDDHCCHNGKLLEIDGEIFYLPFDFDGSGLVNAEYAKPDPSLRLRNVRKRRYRGFCIEDDLLMSAILHLRSREREIQELVMTTPGLNKDRQSRAWEYLEQFFDKAENEEKLLKSFQRQCLDPRS